METQEQIVTKAPREEYTRHCSMPGCKVTSQYLKPTGVGRHARKSGAEILKFDGDFRNTKPILYKKFSPALMKRFPNGYYCDACIKEIEKAVRAEAITEVLSKTPEVKPQPPESSKCVVKAFYYDTAKEEVFEDVVKMTDKGHETHIRTREGIWHILRRDRVRLSSNFPQDKIEVLAAREGR